MNKETKTLLWKPHSESKDHPADRRRLGWYLKSSNKINVVDGNADFVYFTLSSDLPAILKSIKDDAKKNNNKKYIFDFCDSLLEQNSLSSFLRGLLYSVTKYKTFVFSYKRLLRDLVQYSDAVVVSSLEQKKVVKELNQNVHLLFDVFEELQPIKISNESSSIDLIWEGLSSGNSQSFLLCKQICQELKKITQKKINIRFVTDLTYHRLAGKYFSLATKELLRKIFSDTDINFEIYEWSPENLSHVCSISDVSIIPLPDDAIKMRKPENKLILFMKMGIPCLTSDTNSYRRVAEDSKIQIICESPEHFAHRILELIKLENKKQYIKNADDYLSKFRNTEILEANWDNLFKSLG